MSKFQDFINMTGMEGVTPLHNLLSPIVGWVMRNFGGQNIVNPTSPSFETNYRLRVSLGKFQFLRESGKEGWYHTLTCCGNDRIYKKLRDII